MHRGTRPINQTNKKHMAPNKIKAMINNAIERTQKKKLKT